MALNNFQIPNNMFGMDYNKFMAQYNKYSPYLKFAMDLSRGKNAAKSATEAYLDKTARAVPGYGQIYSGIKTFNDVTGGVNFNKMLHIKNPITQGWNGLWGVKKPKTPEEQQAEDPEYAKYMASLSDTQNAAAASERSALERRRAIQPMQDKAVSDYMDILQNGLSSRQLAPVYAAGEARNRAIGASAEAGLMSQVANRGMGGGIQAGLEAAVQANRNALSADLNSRITGQQIAARPGMLGQAANMTMGLENQLQQELAQDSMNRINAANVGLQAYNAAQQNKRMMQAIQYERENARNLEQGTLLGKFGPDIAKGIKALIAKGIRIPGITDNPGATNPNGTVDLNLSPTLAEGSTPTIDNDTSGGYYDYGQKYGENNPGEETNGETSYQTAFDPLSQSRSVNPEYMPVDPTTELKLSQSGSMGFFKPVTLPEYPDVEFVYTPLGWKKQPKRTQGSSSNMTIPFMNF